MRILLSIEGGLADELGTLERTLKQDLRRQGVRSVRTTTEVEQGALGAVEVLQFLGEDVALPTLLAALQQYVTERLRGPRRGGLKIEVARTDLPDGTRRSELTVEGQAKDVAAVLKELG
ncbi:hypothetical protein OG233_28345 [Streptomyces sp. NBC_01218]|uniref:effector-associated constant component EACC1 n=1 Tax=unclassified Streptomyces TaxID=2593676 RepID=UPI0023B88FA0|nr:MULTISPECIES: hypothetical protein [unclassified Streptomyces]WEH43113.1 hypothetical protein PZB77_28415 [Streptomyces sp. AM 2-1-1]WSQ54751.1 hypothetical protein OG233_28345 [Streptomyces sp. NBC_01218]